MLYKLFEFHWSHVENGQRELVQHWNASTLKRNAIQPYVSVRYLPKPSLFSVLPGGQEEYVLSYETVLQQEGKCLKETLRTPPHPPTLSFKRRIHCAVTQNNTQKKNPRTIILVFFFFLFEQKSYSFSLSHIWYFVETQRTACRAWQKWNMKVWNHVCLRNNLFHVIFNLLSMRSCDLSHCRIQIVLMSSSC